MLNNFCAFDPPGCCRSQQVDLSENPTEKASLCQSWWSKNKSYFHPPAPPSGFLHRCPFHIFSSPNSELLSVLQSSSAMEAKLNFTVGDILGRKGEDAHGKEAWRKPRFPQTFMTFGIPSFLPPSYACPHAPSTILKNFSPIQDLFSIPTLDLPSKLSSLSSSSKCCSQRGSQALTRRKGARPQSDCALIRQGQQAQMQNRAEELWGTELTVTQVSKPRLLLPLSHVPNLLQGQLKSEHLITPFSALREWAEVLSWV